MGECLLVRRGGGGSKAPFEFKGTGSSPTMTIDVNKQYRIYAFYDGHMGGAAAGGVYNVVNGSLVTVFETYSQAGLSNGLYYRPSISGTTLKLSAGYSSSYPCYSYVYEV